MFSLICAWTTGRVSNRDAGDLRCNCAHYDVTVMAENCWSVTMCYLKSLTPSSWDRQSYLESKRLPIEDDRMKRKHSPYHEGQHVSFSVDNHGGAHTGNWTLGLCLHSPKSFCSCWISLKRSSQTPQMDCWSSPLPSHIFTWATELEPSILVSSDIWLGVQGAVSIRKTVLPGMAIPMLKIRRPNGRLIFNMEIAIRR